MGFLLAQFRKIQLQQEQNDVQYQLLTINQKMGDLHKLSTTLATNNVTMSDLASLPPSLFGTGINAIMQGNMLAAQYANQVNASLMGQNAFAMAGPYAQQYQYLNYCKAFEAGLEDYKKRITAQLNEQEKQLQNKKTSLETREKCIEQEVQAMDKQIDSGIKSSISTYGLNA